jgi:two-component system, NtrC family, sensor histidine kinase AtoS
MIQKPQIRDSDYQKNFEISLVDLRNLIDEIIDPSLIVTINDNRIIAANIPFLELAQVGAAEFSGTRINEVIQPINLSTIIDGAKTKVSLLKKNNESQDLVLEPKFLNQSKKLLLLIFKEPEESFINNKNSWEEFSKEQVIFLSNFAEFSYEELLSQMLQIGKRIIDSEELSFYLLQKTGDPLKRFAANESNFPEIIPYIEINRIKEIDFWEPGKRVLSEIHRAGRLNKFNSVITVPLSNKKEYRGLLVSAEKSASDLKEKASLLIAYSDWVATNLKLFEEKLINDKELENTSLKKEKLETAFNHLNDCEIVLSEQNEILEFNENFLLLLDYLPIEILNKRIEEIINNQKIIELVETRIQNAENQIKNLEIFNRHGEKKIVDINMFPFSMGSENRKLLIIKDETRLAEIEKRVSVLQKNAAMGELLAEFAHDVRNIINRITTGLQVLVKKMNPDESVLSSIQEIQNECFNLTDLMESVLSFSRQKYENFQLINIKDMVEGIIFRSQKKAEQSYISIIFQSKDGDLYTKMDQRSMERAIVNLINNGIEAIGKAGGTISVLLSSCMDKPGYLLIQIADTGPGIPQAIQSNLYKKFSSGKVEGTGLGLFITQKIIEDHKGSIDLETFPGGTIFKIYLPNEKQGVEL